MKRSNCLFFALKLWLARGGYICIRRVRPPFPYGFHFAWSKDRVHWLAYEPKYRMNTWFKAIFHKFWYTGRIRRYDTPWKDDK